MPEQAAVRLDLVVRRRDRILTAIAIWLFLALIIYMYWMILLVFFWGILENPLWSLPLGLVGTGLLLWWGVRVARGSLRMARQPRPHLLVAGDEIAVQQVAEPGDPLGSLRLPRSAVDVVVVDAPTVRQRRADRVRFPVYFGGPTQAELAGWLYYPNECPIPALGLPLGSGRAPNLLVLTNRTVRGSFTAELADPDTADVIFDSWPVRRQVQFSDVERFLQNGSLPVFRHGEHGLREVRFPDRYLARVIDGVLLVLLLMLVVLRFVPLTVGNVIVSFFVTWFLLEVPLTAWSGMTVGKFLLGLRVVRIDNGSERVGLSRATTRWSLRIVNGVFANFTHEDSLGRVAPSLSLVDGIGAGTLVVADGEFRRMRAMTPDERGRAIRETVTAIEAEPPTVSARAAWISTIFVTIVIVAFFVTL